MLTPRFCTMIIGAVILGFALAATDSPAWLSFLFSAVYSTVGTLFVFLDHKDRKS